MSDTLLPKDDKATSPNGAREPVNLTKGPAGPQATDADDASLGRASQGRSSSERIAPDRAAADRAAPPSKPTAARRGNGVAILALLVGVAGLAAAGWGVWQVRTLQSQHLQQVEHVQNLGNESQQLALHDQQLMARLDQLPAAAELENRRRLIVQLQNDQQHLSQRLETVLGASRKDWRLAESEHLLRLASLRLSALQDINSAEALVQGADDILREQDDVAAFAAREQLAKSLQALRSVDQPDRTGLFLQIAALREHAAQLNELAPVYEDRGGSLFGIETKPNDDSGWRSWWSKISRNFRVDFHADRDVKPLLAGQSLAQVRLALSLALEQAQWAALNGEQVVYEHALDQALSILDGNFNAENPQSKVIRSSVVELHNRPVKVNAPDLGPSLSAVQAYLLQLHKPAESLSDSANKASAPEKAQQQLETSP